MQTILAALLVLASTTALANILPPPEYDRPFKGKVTAYGIDKPHPACFGSIACTYLRPGHCIVYLPNWLTRAQLLIVWRHERGHCNGWPWYHPNPRYVR